MCRRFWVRPAFGVDGEAEVRRRGGTELARRPPSRSARSRPPAAGRPPGSRCRSPRGRARSARRRASSGSSSLMTTKPRARSTAVQPVAGGIGEAGLHRMQEPVRVRRPRCRRRRGRRAGAEHEQSGDDDPHAPLPRVGRHHAVVLARAASPAIPPASAASRESRSARGRDPASSRAPSPAADPRRRSGGRSGRPRTAPRSSLPRRRARGSAGSPRIGGAPAQRQRAVLAIGEAAPAPDRSAPRR